MKTISILLFFFLCSISLQAQIVIPFENAVPVPTICGDSWVESGLNHTVTNYPGIASCGLDYNNLNASSLWLFPALTKIDLGTISGITKIEVDVTGHCGSPCANFRVYDTTGSPLFSVSETSASGLETLTYLHPGIPSIGHMEIDGFEGEFHEIRIYNEEICDPKADIAAEKGDVYIEDSCFGVILTSPNGNCFRVKVDDTGQLISSAVPCP